MTLLDIEILVAEHQRMVLAHTAQRHNAAAVRAVPLRERIALALIALAVRIAPVSREARAGIARS